MQSKVAISSGELAIVHRVEVAGAPTLVFLHDSLGCIQTWRDFPHELATQTGCNYLIYDRLGHGASSSHPQGRRRQQGYLEAEADILIDLLQRLHVSQPLLFGHSDGASIALIAAAQNGNNIKGLILEAPHIFVEDITLEGVHKTRENYPGGILKQLLTKYHGDKTDDVFYAWADTWLSAGFRTWNIEHLLPQISCPCLIVQGEQDEYGTMWQLEGIANSISGAAKVEVI
ncbi:MAG: alpha/beta hydrolase, partial [Bacteroidota bacterium]